MRIPLFHVDAFATRLFSGNPAAVCPLEAWLPDATLQAIAAENNLAETAFLVRRADGGQGGGAFDLRWFTPAMEVDLCGHATLAAGFVVRLLEPTRRRIEFATRSGTLVVEADGDLLAVDLPARPPGPCEPSADLAAALRRAPRELLASERDHLAVFETEAEVRSLSPDFERLRSLPGFAVIATAPADRGQGVDFVSRFFAPKAGVPEDPVTGSAHCVLVPYWSRRLGRSRLAARQVSRRGGELRCLDLGDRVRLSGGAVLYLRGEIELP